MIRKAKRSSAANFDGSGLLGSVFGRALATRGASPDVAGSGAPSLWPLAVALVSALMVFAVGPSSALAAVTSKGVVGTFGSTGAYASQLTTPRGVAVNQSSGNVYAVDGANNRIVEFDSNGNFLRAFGQDVVSSGPDQANEVQTVVVTAASGNFTLTFNGATTANLAATATAAEVQAALNALSTVSTGGGSVAVGGGPGSATGSTPYVVTFNGGPLAHANAAQITATNVSLAGGSPASAVTTATQIQGAIGFEICATGNICQKGTTGALGGVLNSAQGIAVNQETGNLYVTDSENRRVDEYGPNGNFIAAFGQAVVASGPDNVSATSAVQTLNVTATGGKYTLTFGGKTTAELEFNAAAATIQSALTGLASIGSGNATVSETSPGLFQITFAGALANNPEPLITAASAATPNELTGGIVSVINTTTGASGFTACLAAAADVCKAGGSVSTGGAFKSTFNGYPAVAPAGAPNAGDVLVADPANLRVQEFSAAGAFVRAFGFDVVAAGPDNNGTTNFEVCSKAAGDACKSGVTGSGSGQFSSSVNRVAEDAEGDVYTVESGTNFRVQKFTLPANVLTPQGNFSEANLKGTAASNAPLDIAVDPASKDVLVTKAFAAGATPSCPGSGLASVAERRIVEVSQAGGLEATHMACAAVNEVNGIATRGSTGDVYVASTTGESRLLVANTPLSAPTDGFSGVSEISAHGATVSGFVNPNGPATLPYGLITGYHFNYKRTADSTFAPIPAADASAGRGTTNVLVSQKLPGLEAGTSYDVALVATKPFGIGTATTATFTFTTPAAGAEVGVPAATTAATATGARAALWGSVTPNSQATTYRFEYGLTAAYGAKAPASDASVGAGATAVPVAQYLEGLQPDTTYHFRLVASNASGAAASPDQTFTTPPLGSALPDNRGAELVSPADKGSSGSVADFEIYSQVIQGSPSGGSFIYPIQNGTPTSTAGGWTRWRSTRSGGGWLAAQLSPPSLIKPPKPDSFGIANPSLIDWAAPDLSCGFLETYNPLTADTPKLDVELGVTNLYRWNADGSYQLVTNRVPLNPEVTITSVTYSQITAADDCSRVYFRTPYVLIKGASGLYEWDEGTLRDGGVLPNGAVGANMTPIEVGSESGTGFGSAAVGGELDARGTSRWGAVTPEGSLFFTALSNQGPDSGTRAIFLRKGGGASVLDISQSQTAVATVGARYEAASRDGGQVFFRANYGIAATASAGPTNGSCAATEFNSNPAIEKKPCDLYDYDVKTGHLSDLSADPNPADAGAGAQIQGTVAVSEDGSYVYFAALGQLVPGKGRTYAQNIAGQGSANVYLAHSGALSYVTTLNRSNGNETNGDLFGGNSSGGGAVLMRKRSRWTAAASADGRSLVFESAANLTGYNSGGAKEAYLYSADSGQLTCVSCRVDGLPSIGTSAGNERLLPNAGELPDYRARAISADGSRVFFSSVDVLGPGAVAGQFEVGHFLKTNVYEWENGQVRFLATVHLSSGNGFGRYLDSSASGDDVFIGTDQRLAPQDNDFVADVYDLRVGGGFAVPPPAVPCDPAADQCQGTPAAQPPTASPAGAGFEGPGNPPLAGPGPRPRCGKGKVRKQGKCVKKPHKKASQSKRAANNDRGGAK